MKTILSHILSDEIKNVIIDCDTGADGDDQFALAYALAAPRLNILGVCSEPFNDPDETPAQGAAENAEIIVLAGKDIPSVAGATDFITRRGAAVPSPAVDFIKKSADECDGKLYIIMSGCCTNTASALMLYSALREKIVAVWLAMTDIYGDNTGSEYNFMNDPAAGEYLFSCGVPLVLIPTKLIHPFAASKDDIDRRFGSATPICRWLTRRFREITWAKGLWDLGAEAALIRPDLYKWEIVPAPIMDRSGNVIGWDEGREIIYAAEIDTYGILADAAARIKGI